MEYETYLNQNQNPNVNSNLVTILNLNCNHNNLCLKSTKGFRLWSRDRHWMSKMSRDLVFNTQMLLFSISKSMRAFAYISNIAYGIKNDQTT